jgi:catechol 2,3-dioxygenase-like lactoylglutathione lyase family enzyme
MKEAGVPVVTRGAAPVAVDFGATKGRAVIVRDPDGHPLQLVQPDSIAADAPAGEVIGGGVRVTVNDTDRTTRLYRDLGLELKSGRFAADRGFGALTGFEAAQYRLTQATIPGEPHLTFEFIEFKGVDRKPVRARIQDPGAMRFQLTVRNLEAAVAKFKKSGGEVASFDGQPVKLNPTGPPAIVVRDPNNFFIILQQQAAPK